MFSSFKFIPFCKSCSLFQWRAFTAYILCLRNLGIGIRPLVITWYTSIFNRMIQKIGCWRPKFQRTWFVCGTWITLFALPFALYFVIQSTLVLLVSVISKGDKSVKTVAPYLEPAVRNLVLWNLIIKLPPSHCFSIFTGAWSEYTYFRYWLLHQHFIDMQRFSRVGSCYRCCSVSITLIMPEAWQKIPHRWHKVLASAIIWKNSKSNELFCGFLPWKLNVLESWEILGYNLILFNIIKNARKVFFKFFYCYKSVYSTNSVLVKVTKSLFDINFS